MNYSIEDCCVWIDPLDGTVNYVNGEIQNVTVLIGLAVKGKPQIGLISCGFEDIYDTKKDDLKFLPRTYVGDTQVNKVFEYKSMSYDEHVLCRTHLPFESYDLESKKEVVVTTSKHHYSEKVEQCLKFFGENVKKDQTSGCGYKYLGIINGKFDAYLQNKGGASKWDTISGEALMECLGGVSTDF